MTTPPSSEFSYDLYPGLDADLEAALARNIATGEADPGQVATSGLANSVSERLDENLTEEARQWAGIELYTAAMKWHEFDLSPDSRHSLGQGYNSDLPKRVEQVGRLFKAKNNFLNSGYQTPEGTPLGETMKLVMIPWQHFQDHLGDMRTLLRQMGRVQKISREDYLNDSLMTAITEGALMYQKPRVPGSLMTAAQYLEMKIKQDGPWGVMLAQTSDEAGLKHLEGQSPDQLTTSGGVRHNLRLKNIPVDGMGVFEWWALTLQEDQSQLSKSSYSWLLANRLDTDSVAQVPFGCWGGGQVGSSLRKADDQDNLIRLRLAVM